MANEEPKFTEAILIYLSSLRELGFTSMHVGDIIPRRHPRSNEWSQFPYISEDKLEKYNIKYDRMSGWFTLTK